MFVAGAVQVVHGGRGYSKPVRSVSPPRLNTLAGKTVCMVWNNAFKSDVTLPVIGAALKRQFPDATIVPYTALPVAPLPEPKNVPTLGIARRRGDDPLRLCPAQSRAMGTVLLVRHGQASFGAADYDQLSELGARQCAALGDYLAERGRRFDVVLTGTLKRHTQSLEAIASRLPGLPPARAVPALDEYDAERLVRAVAGGPVQRPGPDGDRREHFRLLREALARWMEGAVEVPGMPSWAAFRGGVAALLDELRADHRAGRGAQVLVVSSGGPIATAIAHVLGAPPPAVVSLNLQMRNSALSELSTSASRHWLAGFNSVPHLDHPARAGWITYS